MSVCPTCEAPLSLLLFMGVEPEFLACKPCGIAFPLPGEVMPREPVARVIAEEGS